MHLIAGYFAQDNPSQCITGGADPAISFFIFPLNFAKTNKCMSVLHL